MRKLFMFVALVLGMVSCQNDLDGFDANVAGEKEVVVSVSLPEGTRANSAVGAISNDVVASDEYTLRYIFQVWDEAKQQNKDAVVEYSDETTVSFPVRLVPGRNYRFVVWADVVREADKKDLHYDTTEFPAISLKNTWVAMDETRDAYTASELITNFSGADNYIITLKRPFAKLRVITTDMNELMDLVPTTATVTYTTKHYHTFNALESKPVADSKNRDIKHEGYTIKAYDENSETNKVLFTDYFFATTEDDVVNFTINVFDEKNVSMKETNFSTAIPVKRNHLTTLIGDVLTEGNDIEVRIDESFDDEIEEVFNAEIPYITFTSETKQTLSMSKPIETLEYSVNDGNWIELGSNTVTFGGNYGNLRLRARSLIGTATDNENYSKIKFGDIFGRVACSGDIRTLIDYKNYATVDTSQARFCSLFSGCYPLTQAPELPATTLADYCYYAMFNTCVYLTKAPELPATTLSKGCYSNMFIYCESLTETLNLPATTLVESCYSYMFRNCIKLKKAYDLTATTLAPDCYSNMFRSCSSLEVAPNLSATTLAESCCSFMFYSCSNLKKAPNLPATTLAPGCYVGMFSACKKLATAPELPATTLAELCYYMMFGGCTSLVNAPELPATTLDSQCYISMFMSCTSLVNAPELPATKLDSNCYENMFYGCTSLVNAPELPATKLEHSCYRNMFEECSNLKNITMLATDIEAYNCLYNWVSGVSSEGTFTKSAGLTSIPEGNSGIPTGWTVINK